MPPRRRTTTGSTAPNPNAPRPRVSDEELRKKGFTPFLRPEHVTEGDIAMLTGFNSIRDANTEKEQILCEIELENGHKFTLGVRQGSPDHRILHHALGHNWRMWRGSVGITIGKGRQGGVFCNVKDANRNEPVWAYDGGTPGDPGPTDDDNRE